MSCNYGTCINEGTSYRCECHRGYEGPACDRQIDPCSNFVCYNGGSCVVQQDNQPMCQCAHGYRGPNCYESDGMCISNQASMCIYVCHVTLFDEIKEMPYILLKHANACYVFTHNLLSFMFFLFFCRETLNHLHDIYRSMCQCQL